jgi:hypothetical protein
MTSASAVVTAPHSFVGPRGLWGALVEAGDTNHLLAQERVLGLHFRTVTSPVLDVRPVVGGVDVFRAPEPHEPLVLDLAVLDCLTR